VFRKSFDLFIFSSLYIALCAVLMIWQTNRLLTGSPLSGRLAAFVFFSTICSYNFHWYLTPASAALSYRVRWTQRNKALHFILYLAGAIGAIVYFFSLRMFWPALCLGGLLTFLYSAPKLPQTFFKELKKIAVGKTLFLALVWMYVTTMLPVFIAHAPWTPACTLYAINRFFLIYAICILFDYRDREDDRSEGIRSLITYLDEKGIDTLFTISLILFAASGIGLFILPGSGLSANHYPLLTLVFLLAPGIIVAALYGRAKKSFADYLYYFVLDGLMMFSALLMLIFRI
jgi:4-hydroxybenzoate polyprenyltransferase